MQLNGAKGQSTSSARRSYKIHIAASAVLFVAATIVLAGQARLPATPPLAADFSSPDRYLTHVTTDKPIYRGGENVYVRGVVLSVAGHVPKLGLTRPNLAYIEIKGPKNEVVTSGASAVTDSAVGFAWNIPPDQSGGEYTVRISHPSTGDAPAERKFDIRAYRAPRLKSQIVFVRDGYGPGDTVMANLHVDRAEGGAPAGARVSVSARVDGEEVWKGETTVDAAGNAGASFKLPAAIARGEGTIAMVVADGGVVETATKTIPILLQTLDIHIYPEGGDLIAGLPTRVYVEGKTPAQKPADMAGVIVNRAGHEVGVFRTEHEGRGRFALTPAKGEVYSLRVTEPAGIKTTFPLPAVKESGVVIGGTTDVAPRQKDILIRVGATTSGAYSVVLSQRGLEVAFKPVKLKANMMTDVTFSVPSTVDGVIVATVYDDRKVPMAERLLFRQPDRNLKVRVVADQAEFVPGDKVTLRVSTTDEAGKPVGAVVGLTVTDSSVLEMIEKREQAPRLPVMVLFENDVKNLSDAHVYMDETNPKAPLATDLLLGTQGWRRFAAVDLAKFIAVHGDSARRALAINMRTDAERAIAANFPPDDSGRNVLGGRWATDAVATATKNVRKGGLAQALLMNVNADVGVVLDEAQIQGLPLVGNDPLALITTLPGYRAFPLGNDRETGLPPWILHNVRNGLEIGSSTVLNPDLIDEVRLILAPVDAERGNARTPWNVVRQFAYARSPWKRELGRADFDETVFWHAGVKTDASTGIATVSFNLSDSVTSFRVLADAYALDGALGSVISSIESVKPFFMEPKLPLQVTGGDVIQLPVSLVNGGSKELAKAEVTLKAVKGLELTLPADNGAALRGKERARRLMQVEIGRDFSGMADLKFEAKAGDFRDSVSRKLDIRPFGYPYERSASGILEANSSKAFEFTLPAETIPGSVSTVGVVYPGPLATMTEALQSLLREPNGCFEQTSSTSYPMVMAQQYFMTHSNIDAAIIEKTKVLLDSSYKKLTSFESRSRGYEWFGADPGHEALTAYGLLQFIDMSQVRNVDAAMIQRTRAWLLARRDGSGGFSRNAKSIDSFGGAPQDTTNAYITWTLVESGEKGLEKEVAMAKSVGNSSKDSYVIALAANILHVTGDRPGARELMEKLSKLQHSAGYVNGAVTSITRSGGDALNIETTALAALAWMREPSYAVNADKALRWIAESNKNGRFGSTQSTILALRSIIAYDAARPHAAVPGRILFIVDGKPVGEPVPFTPSTRNAIIMPDIGSDLTVGKHTVALRMEDGSDLPFSMTVKYHSVLPDSAEQTKVGIQVALRNPQMREGEVTEANVTISNKADEAVPTPVAIIGIPGGLEVRHDQLKELVKSGRIDAYEVIGRDVVLYWRFIKARDKFDVPLSLVAAVPGSYTGPASRAYLYYTDEFKNWAPAMKVMITPR